VFFKREVLGEDTPVICKDEGITSSNCWVILHRARIALRTVPRAQLVRARDGAWSLKKKT
jgi:hypothetical protein